MTTVPPFKGRRAGKRRAPCPPVRAGALPPGPDGYRPLGRREIARAVRAGSARALSQPDYMGAVSRALALDPPRGDGAAVVRGMALVYARWACWQTRTTRPGRERVCELVRSPRRRPGCAACAAAEPGHDHPLSITAYKAGRRWLEAHGLLGTVREGWTAHLPGSLRPAVLDARGTEPSEAATYVLCVPHAWRQHCRRARRRAAERDGHLIRPLSSSRSEEEISPPRRPQPRSGALRRGVLAHVSDRALNRAAARLRRHGATDADIAYAVEHQPSGRAHIHTAGVRYPAAWVTARLRCWHAGDGGVHPLPSQVRAAADAARRAEQAADRAERERLAAARVAAADAGQLDGLRAERGWKRGPRAGAERRARPGAGDPPAVTVLRPTAPLTAPRAAGRAAAAELRAQFAARPRPAERPRARPRPWELAARAMTAAATAAERDRQAAELAEWAAAAAAGNDPAAPAPPGDSGAAATTPRPGE